jgi:hypothetical protein
MSTTFTTRPQPRLGDAIASLRSRLRPITRRDVQIALGVLWVLDGALQAQPFMFTRAFGTQLIGGVGQGQPGVVSGPVHLASVVIAASPVLWNVLAVAIQLLLGVGLLFRRTARFTLAASIVWALGVWYAGEGLSGMASGHASLITGAPGSALLYAVVAAAAWPRGGTSEQAPASWLAPAWAVLWVGAAIFQLLPGQNTGPGVASLLQSSASAAPHWLARIDTSLASWASRNGALSVSLLVAGMVLIGTGALARTTRSWAVSVGLLLSVAIWIFGQDLGQLYSGQATDPNTAPLIALMAVVLLTRAREAVPGKVWHPLPHSSGARARILGRIRMYACPGQCEGSHHDNDQQRRGSR